MRGACPGALGKRDVPQGRPTWRLAPGFGMLVVIAVLALVGPALSAADLVAFHGPGAAGTVRIETGARLLYLMLGNHQALRYRIGVGRAGRQWAGHSVIAARLLSPHWIPPAEIRRDNPLLPAVIAGGNPANPLGAGALLLAGTRYAIHGTNAPGSIGGFVSYGCIRMLNADILDLMARVRIGTRVDVVP